MEIVENVMRTAQTNELVHDEELCALHGGDEEGGSHSMACYRRVTDEREIRSYYGVETFPVLGAVVVTDTYDAEEQVPTPTKAEILARIDQDRVITALIQLQQNRAVVPPKAAKALAKIDADIAALQALLT